MESMFFGASAFNQPLEQWNVGNVTTMQAMFHGAAAFNQPLEQWNVSNVTNMHCMFRGASVFNQPLEQWNVSNVTNMQEMFLDATDMLEEHKPNIMGGEQDVAEIFEENEMPAAHDNPGFNPAMVNFVKATHAVLPDLHQGDA